MIDSPAHIFTYGTLKPGETNFDRYCANRVVSQHPAYIHAELYHFPTLGYPGVIDSISQVHGYVLTFAEAGILVDLDKLEDYHPDSSSVENDYTRKLVMTYTPEGIPHLLAWAYFITVDRISQWGGILVPDGWWESSQQK